MCVNKHGVAMPFVDWHRYDFKGKCQEVEMCQVLTRTWYDIFKDQEKLTAKVADEEAGTAD